MSFSEVNIISSKEEEILNPKILMMVMTTSFFGWRFGCLKDEQKPIWAETVYNYPAKKLELVSPQNRYKGHQGEKWKLKSTPFFFKKRFLLMLSLVEALERVEVWGCNCLFLKKIKTRGFLCWKNIYFVYSCYTTLYLLDLSGFGPKSVFVFFIMQNYPVTRKWNQNDLLNLP